MAAASEACSSKHELTGCSLDVSHLAFGDIISGPRVGVSRRSMMMTLGIIAVIAFISIAAVGRRGS
jgi:hypothetical protein